VDPEKLSDARFVLHISLFTTALSVVNVPATGLTIAKEKFLFTSIAAVANSVLKILLVVAMSLYGGNRLRLFALIMLFLTIVSVFLYQWYCYKTSRGIIRFKINKQKSDYKEIITFTGWSTFGAVASMGNNQGAAMIINYFFGTVLNAAYGIATQVNQYANVFIKSISQAAVPQIMKSYGEGDNARSTGLVYIISRLSSLALLLLLVPIVLFTEEVLILWLKEPPEFSVPFVRFLLINTFIAVLGAGFDASIQSTGNIKKNEIGSSLIFLLQLPIIFILYHFNAPPYANVIVLCIGTLFTKIYQMTLLVRMTNFSYKAYFDRTIWPVAVATLVSFVPLYILESFIQLNVFVWLLISVLWTFICVFSLGLMKKEKQMILKYVKKKKVWNTQRLMF
jgi:O-antigen/teichoic acid export membrane protein